MKTTTLLALALMLTGCVAADPCTLVPASADCDASYSCATCTSTSCESWYEPADGSSRRWECDGIDSNGDGYDDCLNNLIDATCSF